MLSNRLKNITPSYTIGISKRVAEMKADGIRIIDMSIGEPAFDIPKASKAKGISAFESGYTHYDLVPGLLPLRKAIAEKLANENGVHYDASEIVVSSGAKQAITNALLAALNPGDEVIIPAPYWTSYPEMVKLCGGAPVIVQTDASSDYKITEAHLKAHFTSKTKMLILNNPSNPTGNIYTRDELLSIADFCVQNRIWILSDEIYESLVYDTEFVSVASLSEQAKSIVFLVNGLSKSAAMTGLRIGYTAAPAPVAKYLSVIQGHLVSHPSTVSQWAAVGALTEGQDEMKERRDVYKKRRDIIYDKLCTIKGLSVQKPEGAFYFFLDMSPYKQKFPFSEHYSVELCDTLLNQEHIAAVPGIAFGKDDFIRLSYAGDLNDMLEGLDILKVFLEKYL